MRSWTYVALAAVGLALVLVAAVTVSRSSSDYRLAEKREPSGRVSEARTNQIKSAFPQPPMEESVFLNTRPDAGFVGSQACAECHESAFESYLTTTHSQALGDIDVDKEPPDGEFEHTISGRHYQIYRKDGQLWHRESIKTESGEDVLCDYPMRYVIGSGNHSRSYLAELEGFLVQSPATWFAAHDAWDMSPGYENDPQHQGFARPARFLCVNCHAGQVSTVGDSIQRLRIDEQAIGCERCHGPGSLHVDRHRNTDLPITGADYTIVHPGRLDRQRREAICSQCHLATEAHSQVRGRTVADFRPGLRLTDFVVHYQLAIPNQEMSVVGHVEQLHLSKCYQESEMDCTTCHNPHAHYSPEESVAMYRSKCLQCHEVNACGLDLAGRERQSKNDNCVQCHMPTGPTEIAHFAFTHHRIGIHKSEQKPAQSGLGELVAINNADHLPQIDRERCSALAYVALSKSEEYKDYHSRGLDLLYELRRRGLRDPEVEATLADGFWRRDQNRCIEHARTALACQPLSAMTRRNALWVLARAYVDTGQNEQAVATLNQLVRLQREAEDSALLGQSLSRMGRLDEAIDAVRHATEIEPESPEFRNFLGQLHALRGDSEQARALRELAARLQAVRDRTLGQNTDMKH